MNDEGFKLRAIISRLHNLGSIFDIQLGRRNLTPIQRIAITEKYRGMYERQAKENQSAGGGDKKSVMANLPNPKIEPISTRQKLAEVAGVGEKTYAMGSKILQSNNEDIKEKVLSGEMSINAGYNVIKPQKKVEDLVLATVYFKTSPALTQNPITT